MKRIVIILCAALLVASCSKKPKTPQETAQKVITEHVKTKVGNPKSYKAVSFGKLEEVYTTIDECQDFLDAAKSYEDYSALVDKWDRRINTEKAMGNYEVAVFAAKTANRFYDSAEVYRTKALDIKNNFKPVMKGYKMTHDYSVKGPVGVRVVMTGTYYLDKEITKVESQEVFFK